VALHHPNSARTQAGLLHEPKQGFNDDRMLYHSPTKNEKKSVNRRSV